VAERLGVAPALVAQWKAGIKRPSVELAIELEVVTDGWVRVEDSRPDINWQAVRRQRRKAA
jgi:DNA-binding transcriptional regulator YdaS (Cro superfamily)